MTQEGDLIVTISSGSVFYSLLEVNPNYDETQIRVFVNLIFAGISKF